MSMLFISNSNFCNLSWKSFLFEKSLKVNENFNLFLGLFYAIHKNSSLYTPMSIEDDLIYKYNIKYITHLFGLYSFTELLKVYIYRLYL